jgi:hypothetical protein
MYTGWFKAKVNFIVYPADAGTNKTKIIYGQSVKYSQGSCGTQESEMTVLAKASSKVPGRCTGPKPEGAGYNARRTRKCGECEVVPFLSVLATTRAERS